MFTFQHLKLICFLSIFLLVASGIFAQPVGGPEVLSDGNIVFTLAMPNAEKVELRLEGTKAPYLMTKDEKGVWSVKVPKLAPEYYGYSFDVDKTTVLDPNNSLVKPNFLFRGNSFLVPGQTPMPWEVSDVPHGTVHHHFYKSAIVGIQSHYYVYTPPGFDAKKSNKYPVLYLLHGFSDDANGWTDVGNAHVILDNLIAQKKAKPMIVVMPLGYGTMEVVKKGWAATGDESLWAENLTRFGKVLLQEIIPLISKQYPISSLQKDHAIAGLSMGGSESFQIGLSNADKFAYIGGFSSGFRGKDYDTFIPNFADKTASIKKNIRLMWMSCGIDDFLHKNNQNFLTWLKDAGLNPTYVETLGGHEWTHWREALVSFLPLLFQRRDSKHTKN